ncbi:MAG: hypothetical protein LC134_01905 [Chitinophagales bacterium]|nr:hypothetical protein [Chitinophagales bacterium]
MIRPIVKIQLNKLQWSFLSSELKNVIEQAPVKDLEVESLVIAECYHRLIQKFTFFPTGKRETSITFTQAEAWAINKYFATNDLYNVFIRIYLEPLIMPANE